ncbi:MAG: TVP38/TMEM64 family protein [Desulfobulbaceae bacterium A2]|nr:MAG: TVP38/TMEM64 family protein [Desulfobulbaceae bacterium A2]
MNKRLLVLVGLVLLALLFYAFDLGQYLSLATLKQQQAHLDALYLANPLGVIVTYSLIYITVTALSLPGAAVMSLAGGALFGLGVGVVVISLSSTIGATLACAVARYLLRDAVSRRFGDRLSPIDDGVAREGAWYLFSLRLVPVFPFFVVNLLLGLTLMPLRTFFWVSQLGMLPATVVFVNAGRELSRIESPAGILSPTLLFSFALIGIIPLAARRLVTWWRSQPAKPL